MGVFKKLFEFYINSSIHVALAVMAFTQLSYIEFEIETDIFLLAFIGLATISGYNFVKYFGLAKFHHRSLATWLKVIQVFSVLCTLSMVFFFFTMEMRTLIYLACLGFITFLYAFPLLPKKYFFDSNQNLRQISGLKIYIIAFVWAAVTVGLPIFVNNIELHFDVIVAFIQRYLIVLVLTLPFEIRDMNYDSLRLATIPQRIGVKKTKAIGVLLLIVIFSLEFLKDDLSLDIIKVKLIMTVIILMLILGAKKDQSKYYSAFFVEGVPIAWVLLLLALLS